jgi:hypothetical protein
LYWARHPSDLHWHVCTLGMCFLRYGENMFSRKCCTMANPCWVSGLMTTCVSLMKCGSLLSSNTFLNASFSASSMLLQSSMWNCATQTYMPDWICTLEGWGKHQAKQRGCLPVGGLWFPFHQMGVILREIFDCDTDPTRHVALLHLPIEILPSSEVVVLHKFWPQVFLEVF